MLDLPGVTLRKTGGCGEHVERGSSLERERNTLSEDDDEYATRKDWSMSTGWKDIAEAQETHLVINPA